MFVGDGVFVLVGAVIDAAGVLVGPAVLEGVPVFAACVNVGVGVTPAT